MLPVRHLIVCEGESERAYLQRLQSFLEQQELPERAFAPPLIFICPEPGVAKSGRIAALDRKYRALRRINPRDSIQIWADFDLYHRNHKACASQYRNKPKGLPNFLFSFHNFEDFLALHWNEDRFAQWCAFGEREHFRVPLHSNRYLEEFQKIFPGYRKGDVPLDLIHWDSLRNLKRHRSHPPVSNPHDVPNLRGFGDFLIAEIERAYPGQLD